MLELVKMWALVEALGLLCLPLTVTALHNLPDRGWTLSKALGLTIFAFASWLPLMCFPALPYNQPLLWGVGLLFTGVSAVGFWRTRDTLKKFISRNLTYIVLAEVVFLGVVALFGFLRQFRPDIRSWENFMDEGIIAGLVRSPHLPPNDVWYSGFSINYYYYAHFTITTPGKLIGQSPSIIFNTGLAIFFGLTAVNLFGVTSNIVAWARHARRQRLNPTSAPTQAPGPAAPASQNFPALLGATPYGLASLAMGVLFGNLASAGQWWTDLRTASAPYDWFAPSRVIPSTINEFPAFSFLLSDFHAHVLTLAFTILAVGVAFNLLLEHDGTGLRAFGRGWQIPFTLLVSALALGQLFAMNGWDLPTYLGLALVAIVLQQWFAHKRSFEMAYVLDVIITCLVLIALTFLLFLPFYSSYIVPVGGIGLVKPADRSAFPLELLIYGFFLFVFVSLLIFSAWRKPLFGPARDTGGRHPGRRAVLLGILAILVLDLVILLLLHNSQSFVVLGNIALAGVVLCWYHREDHALAFTLLLGTLAFALVAGCEIIYLRDLFESSYPRMNTVFKFYFQAWTLLSLACGAGLFFIGEQLRQSWSRAGHGQQGLAGQVQAIAALPWAVCLSALVVASLIYPLVAPAARLSTYNPRTHTMGMTPTWSLDGLTYLQNCRPPDIYPTMDSDPPAFCQYDVTQDYAALRWINEHIQGDPIIVEAANASDEDYSLNALVSSFTGLPTLMGWPGHEVQWRNGWLQNPANIASFNQRLADIATIYTSPDPQTVLNLLHFYHAQYLYVGAMEYANYSQANLRRFGSFLQRIYEKNSVAIYKVPN